MDSFFTFYLSLWSFACILALGMAYRLRAVIEITGQAYRRYLLMPWKWVSFTIATIGMTVIAPYTGDPTWDYIDALFMSILTFLTAPWSIGTLYLWVRGKRPGTLAYLAMCCWLFSASWSYDLYILILDGEYPHTWWSNLLLSSVLYACAGLMWNLEYQTRTGVIFGFMRENWPVPTADDQFIRIFWFALPFMILVAALILAFVIPVPGLSW